MLRAIALFVGVVVLTLVLSTIFFGETVAIWGFAVGTFAKKVWLWILGITLRDLWILLIPLIKRFLVLELPKKLIISVLMSRILFGPKTRRRIRLFLERMKDLALRTKNYVWSRMERRFGRRASFILSLIAMVAVFLIGLLVFGTYFVVWFGFIRIPKTLLRIFGTAGVLAGEWLKRQVFKVIMFLNLDRLWRFLHNKLKPHHKTRIKNMHMTMIRGLVAHRNSIGDRLNREKGKTRIKTLKKSTNTEM